MSTQASTSELESERAELHAPDEDGGYCFAPAEARAEAAEGGTGAWELLVRRYQPYLLRLAASYRIHEDAHDAVQTTFLRLLEHGTEIRRPEAVRYWLATVLRRECLSIVARRGREQPTDVEAIDALCPPTGEEIVDGALLSEEARRVVQEALTLLPARQQELLTLLSDPDTAGYRTVGERLGMPVGSIGPTRRRALTRLQEALTHLRYDACA